MGFLFIIVVLLLSSGHELLGVNIFENIHLPDNYLLRFLYSTHFKIDEAFTRMKGYFEHREECPQFYPTNGPLDREDYIKREISVVLPDCDREGRPIYILKPANIDCSKSNLFDLAQMDDNFFEYMLHKDPSIAGKGICFIIDLKDHSFGFLRWFGITSLKMGIKKIANLPYSEFKFHVVNKSLMVQILNKVAWPLLPDTSKKNIKLHFNNWESLHEYIDPKFLPQEYGGSKEIDYTKIYQTLFDHHEDIIESYRSSRRPREVKC